MTSGSAGGALADILVLAQLVEDVRVPTRERHHKLGDLIQREATNACRRRWTDHSLLKGISQQPDETTREPFQAPSGRVLSPFLRVHLVPETGSEGHGPSGLQLVINT